MAPTDPPPGLELFEGMNIAYERAYGDNPFKKALATKAISLLSPGARVLDLGCGTGAPISSMLADAGMAVVGIDFAPKMVEIASARVRGDFAVASMADYRPAAESFAAVFIVFSQLSLKYATFHEVVLRAARALLPGGLLCVGQAPADYYVKDGSEYDETGSYCEAETLKIPFFGEDIDTFAMSEKGQRDLLISMGLEIVYETVDLFQPNHADFQAEWQQYIVARRQGDQPISSPRPVPLEAAV